jgi:hypothetical protein
MPEKKQETFTVTDRRLFTSDGEARSDVEKEPVSELTSAPPPVSLPAPRFRQQLSRPFHQWSRRRSGHAADSDGAGATGAA